MARSLISFAALAVLLTACGSEGGPSTDGGKDPITIGLLSATSGPLAAIGEEQNNGFRFYLEQHGGKLGGHPVSLELGDEGAGPDTAIASARRLVTEKRVSALVGITSTATGTAIKQLAGSAKVPMIITSAGDDSLTADGSPYIYRTHSPNGQQCRLAASAMLDTGAGGAYLTWFDSATGRSCGAAVQKALEEKGIKIAGTSAAPLGTTDFQPYLEKIKQSNASSVFAFYAGSDGIAFLKQYVQFGVNAKAKLVVSANMTEEPYLAQTGDSALGVHSVTYYSPLLDNAANAKFGAPYLAKFGHYPNYAAVASYDAAAVLDKVLAGMSTVDKDGLRDALGNIGPVDSPRGGFTFNAKHDPAQAFYLREVGKADGRLVNIVKKDLGRDG